MLDLSSITRSCLCETHPCSRGDQILEVDSVSLRHVALSEAYAVLSECGPGPVSLIIGRHPNPKVRVTASPLCFLLIPQWGTNEDWLKNQIHYVRNTDEYSCQHSLIHLQ